MHVSANAGAPLDMLSHQTTSEMGRCILHLTWSAPDNIPVEDVDHYMIHINGENVINETNNNSIRNLIAHPVCVCGSHIVSITGVDKCNRVGQRTPNMTVVSKPLPNLTCHSEPAEPVVCDCPNEGKFAHPCHCVVL